MEKTEVLVSCVGNQDPVSERTEQEGAIVTAVRHLEPDLLYLLPSMEKPDVPSSTEENAGRTEEWLEESEKLDPEVYHKPLDIRDPTDYPRLREEMTEAFNEIRNELGPENTSYQVNISSGTPQMEAVWLALADAGLLKAGLWKVANPEEASEPTVEGRVSRVDMRFLEEDKVLTRAAELVGEYDFRAAAREVDRLPGITTSVRRKDAAKVLEEVFVAYDYWDMLDIPEARVRLEAVLEENEPIENYRKILELLEEQLEALEDYTRTGRVRGYGFTENTTSLLDIYHNLARRYQQGNYADCLARFWRLYEGTLYYLLRRHDVFPTDIAGKGSKESREKLKRWFSRRGVTVGSGRGEKSSLRNVYEEREILLDVFEEKSLNKFEDAKLDYRHHGEKRKVEFDDVFDKLRSKRNDSITAHGLAPVDEEMAKNARTIGKRLLAVVLDLGEEEIDGYSFAGENVGVTYKEFMESL